MPDVVARALPAIFQALLETKMVRCEAERSRLDSEIEERQRRRAELDAEVAELRAGLARLADDPLVQELVDFATLHQRAPSAESSADPANARDPEATPRLGHVSEVPPGAAHPGATPPPGSGDPLPIPANTSEPPPALSARIAKIMGAEPERSWQAWELMPLLFDDPEDRQNKRRRDTVGKTLKRMVGRGEAALSENGRYTPADNTAKALRHRDTRRLRLVPETGRTRSGTGEREEAVRMAN